MPVKVVKIHPLETSQEEHAEKKIEGACDSPSSDKENTSQENLKKDPQSTEEENRRESLCKHQLLKNMTICAYWLVQNNKSVIKLHR